MHPRLQSQKWRLLRLSTFVATGLSAFAPIIHGASIFPYEQLKQQAGLRYYYLEGLTIILGVLFYAVWLLPFLLPQIKALLMHARQTFLSHGNQNVLISGGHRIKFFTSRLSSAQLFTSAESCMPSNGTTRTSDARLPEHGYQSERTILDANSNACEVHGLGSPLIYRTDRLGYKKGVILTAENRVLSIIRNKYNLYNLPTYICR